jgi:alkanesulfonate monooxygenase SsuD/methylene tetrahydromethanopterin reductase-like flavin-dependent oxidoreductase (luciferase family)
MKLIMMNIPQVPGDKQALRPIGRNADAYQAMVREIEQLVQRADELGVFGFGAAEHHLHTEGYEVMSAPMIFYTRMAAMTKNIKFIPLSLVPVASNPIRIAEEVAMFDQLFPGRIEVGFARGYQSRWLQVLAQDDSITSGVPESDARNREIFNEYVEVIKLAWTQDNFHYNGKHFKVPYPYEGITGYPAVHVAQTLGGDGETEDGEHVHRVGVVPAPITKPYPPLWVPFTFSPQTLATAATEGYRVLVPASKPEAVQKFCGMYKDLAAEAGIEVALGENICPFREIVISESPDEAMELAITGVGAAMYHYFQHFGMLENWRTEADDPNARVILDSPEAIVHRLIEHDFLVIGNVGEVTEQLDHVRTCYGAGGNMEYLSWLCGVQGAVPTEVTVKQLELLAGEVMPKLA